MSTRMIVLGFALACCNVTRAADWIKLEGVDFTSRAAVTVENPADVDDDAALVHISMAELGTVLSDAHAEQVAVVDPTTSPAKREQADKNFVPFQVSGGALIFAVPLKAHEKKQLFIYTTPKPTPLPGFPSKTSFDDRHAYRSFENNFIAFRVETGPGANTTGMAIDMFGKKKAGHGLRLVEIYEQNDYHNPQTWGVDILKVGSGPGLGGAYVIAGDELGRASSDTTRVECVYQGPVETVIRCVAPVEVGGKKVTLTRTLTLVGDDRSVHDHLLVSGDNLDGLSVGVGLRDLPNQTWVEKPDQGYAMVTGDHNQPGCVSIGLSAVFDPGEYDKTVDLPDKKNGGHVYVLKPKKTSDGLVSEHRFTGIWDGDGQVNNPGDLEKTLQNWSKLRAAPVKVEIAKKLEVRG